MRRKKTSFTYPEGIRWLAETCNTSTPARASRPGARAAHGPDAAADVRRFDEQLVLVEAARRIAGREHDDRHLPVPRTSSASGLGIERRVAEDDARPVIFYPRGATCRYLGRALRGRLRAAASNLH